MVERSLYRKNMVLGSYSLVRKWYFKLDMWYLFSSKYIVVLVPRIWFHPLVNHMMLVTTYLRVRNWYFHLTNLVIIHWKTWWSWYRVFNYLIGQNLVLCNCSLGRSWCSMLLHCSNNCPLSEKFLPKLWHLNRIIRQLNITLNHPL